MTDNDVSILLVEDNPNDLKLTMYAFATHNLASKVHAVRDGVEAIEFIFCTGRYADREIENAPQLVLLDLKLPLMDGIEVLQIIKADPRTRKIPVVVMTSSRQECDILETYQLGVNSYIVKPVDFDQFTDLVEKLGYYWLLCNQPPIMTEPSQGRRRKTVEV